MVGVCAGGARPRGGQWRVCGEAAFTPRGFLAQDAFLITPALRIALNPTAFGDYNGAMGERTPEWKINSGQGVGTPLSLSRGRVGGEGNLEKKTLASGVRSCRAWPCTLSLLLCLECSLSHPRFPWDIFSLVFLDQGPRPLLRGAFSCPYRCSVIRSLLCIFVACPNSTFPKGLFVLFWNSHGCPLPLPLGR